MPDFRVGDIVQFRSLGHDRFGTITEIIPPDNTEAFIRTPAGTLFRMDLADLILEKKGGQHA